MMANLDFHFFSRSVTSISPLGLQCKVRNKKFFPSLGNVFSLVSWIIGEHRNSRLNILQKNESARRGIEFFAGEIDLFTDESGLPPGNEDERRCENGNDSSCNRCNCGIVCTNPSKPALNHEPTRGEHVLFLVRGRVIVGASRAVLKARTQAIQSQAPAGTVWTAAASKLEAGLRVSRVLRLIRRRRQ